MKTKSVTTEIIAAMTAGIDLNKPAEYGSFLALEQTLTAHYGEKCKSRSSEDRDVKGRIIDVEEVRSWPLNRTRRINLEYSTHRGLVIYTDDEDIDWTDGNVWFLLPAKPLKKPRTKKEEKFLMTPNQFEALVYQQLNVNERDVVKDDHVEFMAHVLDHMLGEPDGQNSDSAGNGTREWYAGNAQLTLAWSAKGMTLKINDDGPRLV